MKSKVIALTLTALLGTTIFGGVQAQAADTETNANMAKSVLCNSNEGLEDDFYYSLLNFYCLRGFKPVISNRPCNPSVGGDNEIVPPAEDDTEVIPPTNDDEVTTPPSNGGEEVVPPTNDESTTPPSNGETENKPSDDVVNDSNTSDKFMAQVEQAIYNIVNEERTKMGLSPLAYNSTMEKYARIKSQDMGDKNYFSHEDLNGNMITSKMEADGVSYRAWGENIAYIGGSVDANTLAQQFMTNWMNSAGHRANILSTDFDSIGVGVYKVGNKVYATQEFYR